MGELQITVYIYEFVKKVKQAELTRAHALAPTPQVLVQVPSNESLWEKTLKISKNSITILIAVGLFCTNIYLLSVHNCDANKIKTK